MAAGTSTTAETGQSITDRAARTAEFLERFRLLPGFTETQKTTGEATSLALFGTEAQPLAPVHEQYIVAGGKRQKIASWLCALVVAPNAQLYSISYSRVANKALFLASRIHADLASDQNNAPLPINSDHAVEMHREQGLVVGAYIEYVHKDGMASLIIAPETTGSNGSLSTYFTTDPTVQHKPDSPSPPETWCPPSETLQRYWDRGLFMAEA